MVIYCRVRCIILKSLFVFGYLGFLCCFSHHGLITCSPIIPAPVLQSSTNSTLKSPVIFPAIIKPSLSNKTNNLREVNTTAAAMAREQLNNKWLAKIASKLSNSTVVSDTDSEAAPDNDEDASVGIDVHVSPEDLFEGDILGLDKNVMQTDKETFNTDSVPNIWPNGIVPWFATKTGPYRLDNQRYNHLEDAFVDKVRAAIKIIETNTCVRFKDKENGDADYLQLVASITSYKGYQKKGQQLVQYVPSGCRSQRKILHELMHALGFLHEMARTDRDKYIEVNMANIQEPAKGNFEMYSGESSFHGLPFDADSVVMYEWNEFAKNKEEWTVRMKNATERKVAKSDTLTDSDIFALNDLYGCTVANCQDLNNGRVAFNNKCYFISANTAVTFSEASADCKERNGHMAYLSLPLINVFFDRLNSENMVSEAYWVAARPNAQQQRDDENLDDPENLCTAIINRQIMSKECSTYSWNFICEITV